MGNSGETQNIISRLERGQLPVSRKELSDLLQSSKEILGKLKKIIRNTAPKNETSVLPEAVIEISNYCEDDCEGCEIRESNYSLQRFRLSADEIIETAIKISNTGINSITLKSGRDWKFDTDIIAYLVYTIKNTTDAKITLSMGLRNFDEYRTWKIAGADGYFLYDCYSSSKKTNCRFFEDIEAHVKYLKRLGYNVSLGKYVEENLINVNELIDFIELCKKHDPKSISIEPLLKKSLGFSYSNKAKIDKIHSNRLFAAIAVLRIMFKNQDISSHFSYDKIEENGSKTAIDYGSNMYFIDFTPRKYVEMNSNENSAFYSKYRLNQPFFSEKTK